VVAAAGTRKSTARGAISGANFSLPPQRRVNANDVDIEGFARKPGQLAPNVDFYQYVSDGYFETMAYG